MKILHVFMDNIFVKYNGLPGKCKSFFLFIIVLIGLYKVGPHGFETLYDNNNIKNIFHTLELCVLIIVAGTSTVGYIDVIKKMTNELNNVSGINASSGNAVIGAVEVYSLLNIGLLFFALYHVKNQIWVLAILFFVYYFFSCANMQQLKSIDFKCGVTAMNGSRWFYAENMPSMIGYLCIFVIVVVLKEIFIGDSALDMIKAFAGGVAAFHLFISSVTFCIDMKDELKQSSLLDKAITEYGNTVGNHTEIANIKTEVEAIMKYVPIVIILLGVVYTCYVYYPFSSVAVPI